MELFFIPVSPDDQDRLIFYRPLLNMAFIGNRALKELILSFKEKGPDVKEVENSPILFNLVEKGFFLPEVEPPFLVPNETTAVLLLTNRCQLRCTYCYANAGSLAPQVLSEENAKAVIDLVCEKTIVSGLGSFRIDFHGGGEPSLEWEFLKNLTHYARSKTVPAHISLTSNAIWSESQCEWICENIDEISVSMDGSPSTQKRQRPLAHQSNNRATSSDIVMRNLAYLDQAKRPYGIRMTAITPWKQLKRDVGYILEHTLCRNIQVEPAFNSVRGGHSYPPVEEYLTFASEFMKATQVAKKHKANFYFSGARVGINTRIFCAASYKALVLNPDDDLVACYELTNANHSMSNFATFGHVDSGVIELNQEQRERFYGLQKERFESVCGDCFCKWSCAGDCFTRAYEPGDGGHLKTNYRCELNRTITKQIILENIWEADGFWSSFNVDVTKG